MTNKQILFMNFGRHRPPRPLRRPHRPDRAGRPRRPALRL